jgi:hypothetical protein
LFFAEVMRRKEREREREREKERERERMGKRDGYSSSEAEWRE